MIDTIQTCTDMDYIIGERAGPRRDKIDPRSRLKRAIDLDFPGSA